MKKITKIQERGFGLLSLVLTLAFAGLIVVMGIKIVPAVNESITISKIVDALEKSEFETEGKVRESFSTRAIAEYVKNLKAEDLRLQKNGSAWVIQYDYEAKIGLIGNASLVLNYSR